MPRTKSAGKAKPRKSKQSQPQVQDDKNMVLLTKEGLEKLKEELHHLKTVKRKDVAERLKQAIEYGDLSENSEYDEAKNDQAFTEGRILELEKQVRNVKIISDQHTGDKQVQIGTKVTIQNLTKDESKEAYTIVGSTEADPLNQKISNESPIGEALLGRKKGEVITVEVPAGVHEYKIVNLQ